MAYLKTSIRQILFLLIAVRHVLSTKTEKKNLKQPERELNVCATSVSSADSNCFKDQKLTGGRGCEDALCEAAVCRCDPYCCSILWDSSCSSNMNFFNSGCSAGQLCCIEGSGGATSSFGTATVFGSGCSSGTYSIRDGSDPYVDLTSYTASTQSGKSFDRKACSFAVPVTVDEGFYISVSGFTYDGTTIASSSAETSFTAEHFFASTQGTKLEETFDSSGNIKINYDGSVNSPCGGSFIFRINTGITARGTNSNININKAFSYNLQTLPC